MIFFIDLVITSHISLDLANTAWPKLETCVLYIAVFWLSAARILLSSSLLTRDK